MKRIVLLVVLAALCAAGYWAYEKKNAPPAVSFAKVTRETIINTLSTNGKVEPMDSQDARSEAGGIIARLLVKQGDTVRAGQLLAEIRETGVQQELQAAEAREAQVRADLQTLQQGGRPFDLGELEAQVSRLRSERTIAQRNVEALTRLVQKEAAPRMELEQAKAKVESLDGEIAALEKRRRSLVGQNEIAAAQSRIREAAANVSLAKARISLGTVVAPVGGTIYDLPVKQGGFLSPGDVVASIGRMNPVRVKVYVDEPEMGRIAVKQPVKLTWDAMQGREWHGTVERRPTQVFQLGTRQVGEVLCTIDNPTGELVPGTNVNAFVETAVSPNALTVPKSALRNDDGLGVYVLNGKTVRWQKVKTGVNSALRVEVLEGLREGDAIAVQTDQALKVNQAVTPVIQ